MVVQSELLPLFLNKILKLIMASLRTLETQEKYNQYKDARGPDDPCPLCHGNVLKSFKYWKILENDFPYDKIAAADHLLVLLRHADEKELNENEIEELEQLKETYINAEYEYIIEGLRKKQSIPNHFHVHLIISIP